MTYVKIIFFWLVSFALFGQTIDQYKTTTASGSVNVYTIPNTDFGAYRTNEKWLVDFTGVTTNSGACTLNRAGYGAVSIKQFDGTDPSSGTLKGRVQLSYNGTYFYIVGGSGSGGGGSGTVTSVSATSPLFVTSPTTTPSLTIQQATTSQNGYLTNTDWNTFNNKQGAITLTTTGTSGAATFVGNTLNIPQYAGTTYSAGTGLTLSTNTFSVNTSQNISTLSNLTSNGYIKTSGGAGTLGVVTTIPNADLTNSTISGVSLGSNLANLSIGAELISGGATTYNGSAAKTLAIQSGSVTNAMLAGSIDPTTKISGWPANSAGVLTNNGSGTLTWGSSLSNPMNSVGDIIVGGSSGTATRLGIGTSGQVLTVSAGTPAWSSAPTNNKQAFVGYIFQETFGGTLANYTTSTPASTIAISGGKLNLTGGANNYSNYIVRNYYSAATNHSVTATITPTADGNGIGLWGWNSAGGYLAMEMDANTAGARGTVYIVLGGTRVATSSSVLSYTNSTDALIFTLTRANNTYTGTVYNKTTGLQVSVSWYADFSVTSNALRYFQPGIYIKGGTFDCTAFNYYINQKKKGILFCGDSITEGYLSVTENGSFVDILRTLSLDPIEKMSASSSTSTDWASKLTTEMLNFDPAVIYMMIGMNDAIGSVSGSTYSTNLATIESALSGYKIVYLYVTPHGSSSTINGFINTYNTTLAGKTYKIDTNTPVLNASTSLAASIYISADNVHLTSSGHSVIAQTIQQNATSDIPFNAPERAPSYMQRSNSTFSLDKDIKVYASGAQYRAGSQYLWSSSNTASLNSVVYANLTGTFSMPSSNSIALWVNPTMTATANAQVVYGVVSRDARSLGAFTDGGWYGLTAQTSGGTDIARIGVTSAGSSVVELNASTLLNTTGTANASGSVANLTYSAASGKIFYLRNSNASGAMSLALGNDGAALGAYMQLNGSSSTANSGANAVSFVNPTHSSGKFGWWKSGATPMMELTNAFGGNLSIGGSVTTHNLAVTQTAQSSGVPKLATFIAGANTTTTASTENTQFTIDVSAAQGHSTGTISNDRTIYFKGTTHNFASASTSTRPVTLSISGAPIAGTNATFTNSIGLEIEAANVGAGTTTSYGALINAQTGGTTNYALGLVGDAIVNGHLIGNTGTPTNSAGTGAGTGPTITISGTDMGGNITVATGTSPTASATVVTVTFATAYKSAPKAVVLTPGDINSAGLSGTGQVYVDKASTSTTAFVIKVGSTNLTASTTYVWHYQVIQ